MRTAQGNEKVYLGLQNRRIQSSYAGRTGDEKALVMHATKSPPGDLLET